MIKLYKGDNLKIMNKLFELGNKYNIIYLDPPYNTKNNKLIYHDKFEEKNSSWYSFFNERIKIIKKILDNNSVIYVSIGHEELANAKKILDNAFSKNGFVAIMPRITNKVSKTTKTISRINDFLLIYKRGDVLFRGIEINTDSYKYTDQHVKKRGKYQLRRLDYKNFSYSKSLDFEIKFDLNYYYPNDKKSFQYRNKNHEEKDWCWLWSKKRVDFAIDNDFLEEKKGKLYKKTYTKCNIIKKGGVYSLEYLKRTKPFTSLELTDKKYSNTHAKTDIEKMFSYPKSENLIKFLFDLPLFDKKNILDPFAGSGTSAIVSSKSKFNCDLIQISESTRKSSLPYARGYKNIFELTKAILKKWNVEVKIYE